MALTMIDPTTSWFEVVELPLVRRLKTITVNSSSAMDGRDHPLKN
jgi:hypothetical protein